MSRQDLCRQEERTEARKRRGVERRTGEQGGEYSYSHLQTTVLYSHPHSSSRPLSVPSHSTLNCCCPLEILMILQTSKTFLSLTETVIKCQKGTESCCWSLSPITQLKTSPSIVQERKINETPDSLHKKAKQIVFAQYCVTTKRRHLTDSFYFVNWKKTKDAGNERPSATSETFKEHAETFYLVLSSFTSDTEVSSETPHPSTRLVFITQLQKEL